MLKQGCRESDTSGTEKWWGNRARHLESVREKHNMTEERASMERTMWRQKTRRMGEASNQGSVWILQRARSQQPAAGGIRTPWIFKNNLGIEYWREWGAWERNRRERKGMRNPFCNFDSRTVNGSSSRTLRAAEWLTPPGIFLLHIGTESVEVVVLTDITGFLIKENCVQGTRPLLGSPDLHIHLQMGYPAGTSLPKHPLPTHLPQKES